MTGWDKKIEAGELNSEDSATHGNALQSSIITFQSPKTARKYLPKGTDWYDFWTNKRMKGGRDIVVQTTFDRVPMFVRAGSILPLGPEMQYVGEKTWEQLELRVYPGADADFLLYEDEGDGYQYEQQVYATIHFQWDDQRRVLTIGERQGNYPGMLKYRQFTIVLPDGRKEVVSYDGTEKRVQL